MPAIIYATATRAEALSLLVALPKAGSTDVFATSSDWTPGAGDVKVSLDGAATANVATLPVYLSDNLWTLALSAAEMTADRVAVSITNAGTGIQDALVLVETVLQTDIAAVQTTATAVQTSTSKANSRVRDLEGQRAVANHRSLKR